MRMPGLSRSELAIVVFILLLVIVAGRLPRWGEALEAISTGAESHGTPKSRGPRRQTGPVRGHRAERALRVRCRRLIETRWVTQRRGTALPFTRLPHDERVRRPMASPWESALASPWGAQ